LGGQPDGAVRLTSPSNSDGRSSRFSRPGAWFWTAIVIGAVLRCYLAVFTQGTYDVEIWAKHAAGVGERGVIAYYHSEPLMNHPPFISMIESFLLRTAHVTDIPFRILLRAPFIFLDAGTMLILLRLLSNMPWRYLAAAGYWLNPLSIISSAYQGNTDSAVPFFILSCVYLLSRGQIIGGGMALGAGLWIKLPGVLAAPALFFFVQGRRKRVIFVSTTVLFASITYVPALWQDAAVVYHNVLAYHGQLIQTSLRIPVWGPRTVIYSIYPSPFLLATGTFFQNYGNFVSLAS
jgi:hypothetical protein